MKEILKWILFVLYGQSSKFLNRGWMTLALEQFRVLPSICCGGWLPVAWWKCQQVAPPNRCSLRQFPFSFADPGWSGIWPRCVWFSRIVEFGVLHDPNRTLVIAEKGRWVALPYAECLEESTDPHSLLRWLAHGTIFGISSGQGDAGLSSAAPSYSRAVEREDIPSCGTPGVDITSVVSIGKTSEHVGIGTRTREAKTMITGSLEVFENPLECFPMGLARIFTEPCYGIDGMTNVQQTLHRCDCRSMDEMGLWACRQHRPLWPMTFGEKDEIVGQQEHQQYDSQPCRTLFVDEGRKWEIESSVWTITINVQTDKVISLLRSDLNVSAILFSVPFFHGCMLEYQIHIAQGGSKGSLWTSDYDVQWTFFCSPHDRPRWYPNSIHKTSIKHPNWHQD